MLMLKERLQLLISAEQRKRLEDEARRTGRSVGALVREAIDAQLGTATRHERLRAVEEIAALRGVYLPLEELESVIAEERERATAKSG